MFHLLFCSQSTRNSFISSQCFWPCLDWICMMHLRCWRCMIEVGSERRGVHACILAHGAAILNMRCRALHNTVKKIIQGRKPCGYVRLCRPAVTSSHLDRQLSSSLQIVSRQAAGPKPMSRLQLDWPHNSRASRAVQPRSKPVFSPLTRVYRSAGHTNFQGFDFHSLDMMYCDAWLANVESHQVQIPDTNKRN